MSNLKPSRASFPCNELKDRKLLGSILARSTKTDFISESEIPNNFLASGENCGSGSLGSSRKFVDEKPKGYKFRRIRFEYVIRID
jgi:hypothetical protein